MRISDWSSDVCSSDLNTCAGLMRLPFRPRRMRRLAQPGRGAARRSRRDGRAFHPSAEPKDIGLHNCRDWDDAGHSPRAPPVRAENAARHRGDRRATRSEEHTSDLQSLMRLSYAVFRLKKKRQHKNNITVQNTHTKLTITIPRVTTKNDMLTLNKTPEYLITQTTTVEAHTAIPEKPSQYKSHKQQPPIHNISLHN